MPYSYEHYDISPDIITVAKGLGNGLPVGAVLAKEAFYDVFDAGSHGTTFGGNPIAMAAARAVLQTIFQPESLQEVERKGNYFQSELKEKLADQAIVTAVRGNGLMVGIVCNSDVSGIVHLLIKQDKLVLGVGTDVIQLIPPLIVTDQ